MIFNRAQLPWAVAAVQATPIRTTPIQRLMVEVLERNHDVQDRLLAAHDSE